MAEVTCLSQNLCSTCEENLNAVYKIFRYLQNNLSNNPGMISFDPVCVPTEEKILQGRTNSLEDWNVFNPDAPEAHLRKTLEPLGELITVRIYVYVNHSENMANRRSHHGTLIYVNNTLIKFYIKRQNKVESSSFGSKLVALRIST